jgi:hypothetical protein
MVYSIHTNTICIWYRYTVYRRTTLTVRVYPRVHHVIECYTSMPWYHGCTGTWTREHIHTMVLEYVHTSGTRVPWYSSTYHIWYIPRPSYCDESCAPRCARCAASATGPDTYTCTIWYRLAYKVRGTVKKQPAPGHVRRWPRAARATSVLCIRASPRSAPVRESRRQRRWCTAGRSRPNG